MEAQEMNLVRADWAEDAVRRFQDKTGVDRCDALCDLLGNLMHWSDVYGFDFQHELNRGRAHFEDELEEALEEEREMAKPFRMDYKRNPAGAGNPAQWRAAFRHRLGLDAARAAVAGDSPRNILGVGKWSSWGDVKKAYRALARIHHPDVGGSPETFRRVQGAFEVLEDEYTVS